MRSVTKAFRGSPSHSAPRREECCEGARPQEGRIAVYCNLEEERRSNRRFLEVETRGDDGGFAEAASLLGCECAQQGTRKIKLVLPESVEILDLFRLAAERGVQIRRLNCKQDSLQDIFLKAMETRAPASAPRTPASAAPMSSAHPKPNEETARGGL